MALLVPYFDWQYTHSKNHCRINKKVDRESHVKSTGNYNGLGEKNDSQSFYDVLHESMADGVFAEFQVWNILVIVWSLYLVGLSSTFQLGYYGKFLGKGEIVDNFHPS